MSKIYKPRTEIHYYKLDDGNNHSVHDIQASNIDINAQARTEMSSNPFMWMFNMPNQQDFWKDFIDKT
jgi:hypothetical protein